MSIKSMPTLTQTLDRSALGRVQVSPWLVVAGISCVAGVGNGWALLARPTLSPSPFLGALTMMLATFGGWWAWSFFTHLIDGALFGGHGDYRETLAAFAPAYSLQALSFLAFTHPLGWVWTWIATYLTIVAWAIIGPRRLGMRTYQAVVAATLGLLVWLACLLAFTLAFQWDGMYVGIGAFLA